MEWRISDGLVDYQQVVRDMEERVAAIRAGGAEEMVWLLQHPALYTAGTSAKAGDLLDAGGLPVYQTGRGGQYTYHGPGQRVAYVMLDLQARKLDIRCYVAMLEDWLIATLHRFNLNGERRAGRIGIWIDRGQGKDDKIGAIGVRVRRWVTYHGISLNVEPELSHYAGIVPCGIKQHGVTSLVDLGLPIEMAEVDMQLRHAWDEVFGGPEPL
ncbi:MAG: lipoyl(octanoyl) transferase LipB [Alphaproteobacteria bacterium]|jgi:lipoyl(octanoyl) transferase|nr:lipoyl(octanoyl) transferase LipB [Alphaproteobacteria bacterium]